MKKDKYEFLQYLYKVLKKHDTEILKHFNDDSISDNDYFFYGINSDIMSNALHIVINYLSGNVESAGVDLSCRTIMEAMVILKLDASGKISEKQKTIYRYLYACVDLDNFKKILPNVNYSVKAFEKVSKDKEIAIQAMIEHFKCSREDLSNKKYKIDDPCFYLKTTLKEDIRFAILLRDYPIANENVVKMYEFFSLFIHPRCEMNKDASDAIMSLREKYVDNLLFIVRDYLTSCKLLISKEEDKKTTNFDQDFFYNPILSNNVHNVKDIEHMFHYLMESFCRLKNGIDWFTWSFLEKTKYIVIDMLISKSLGYKEHVISIFKTLIEQYSIYFEICSHQEMKEFNILKKAFWISSRVQFESHFEEMGIENSIAPINDIKEVFEKYYKEKYKLNNVEIFYERMKSNSLYFLSDGSKSYNFHVKNLLNIVFPEEQAKTDIYVLYRISNDMGHASGYNFNASPGLVDTYCCKSALYIWLLIKHFVFTLSDVLKSHNEECNVEAIILLMDLLISDEINTLNKVNESYKEKVKC